MKYIANGPSTGGGAGGAAIQGSGTYSQNTGTIQFANSNGVTFGLTNGVMTASIPAVGGAQTGVSGISAGTTQMTSGTAVFSNSNGISFGVNGNTITASYNSTQFQTTGNYLTTAMASNRGSDFLGTNSAITANGVSATINSSGVSLNFPAFLTTAQPVGAYLTTAALSQDSSKYAGTNGAITGGSITVNTSGVSINLPAYLTTAMASNAGSNFVGVTTVSGTNVSGTFASNGISLSANAGGGAGGVAISASNSSMSSGTITFSNSNGMFFGLSNGVMTASASTAPAGSLFFGSTNGVTFGTSVIGASTTVTASVNSNAGGAAIKASGTYTQNSGTVEFANSNGITFGLSNNGTMTASHNGITQQSTQPVAVSGANGSFAFSTLSLANSNGVSFSTGTQGVYATVATNYQSAGAYLTTAALSQDSSKYAGTNGAITGGSITVNTSGVSINLPAYLTTAMQSQSSSVFAKTGFTSASTAGSDFAVTHDTNGLSMGIPKYLTTAMASNAGSNFVAATAAFNGTNASGTIASNGISISVNPGGGAGVAVSAGGSNFTSGTVTFGNTNGVSFITTNGSVALSFSTAPAGSLFYGSSNGITFGTSVAGASTTVTASHNGITLQSTQPVAVSGANGSFAFSTLSLANSNGVSFSTGTQGVYATVATNYQSQGAYLTTARASTDAIGLNTALTANGVSMTANSSGLSLNFPAFLTTAMVSNASTQFVQANAGFAGTNASGTIASNGISISVAAGGGAAQTFSVSNGTMSANPITFGNSNSINFYSTNGSLVGSYIDPDGWAINGNTAGANSTYFASNGTMYLSGGNNITLSQNGSTLAIIGGAGGGAGYTQSFFQPEVYGNTLTSTHAVGTVYLRPFENGNAVDVDKYLFQQSLVSLTSTRSLSGGVSGVINTGGTGSFGISGTVLMFSRVNTNETNASYNSIITYDSKSYSMGAGYTISQSQSTNVSSATVSFSTTAGVSYIKNIDAAGGFTTSFVTNSSTGSFSSTSTGAGTFGSSFIFAAPYSYMSGIRPLWVPASGTNMTAGEQWIGVIQSTGTGSTGSYSMQAVAQMSTPAFLYFTASTNNFLELGSSVAITTSNWRIGFGSYSASSNTTAAIPLSQVSNMVSNASLYFALIGHTK